MAVTFIVDFQNCFIFILLCLFSILCYYFFFKKPNDLKGYNLPPSPPSLPIIGHLHLLLSLLVHKSLQKLSSKYGPLLHLRVFNVPIVLVSSAPIAYEIFRAQDVNVSTRSLPTNEGSLFFGSSGFVTAPYGDYWKFIKKLITTKLLGPQALERSRGVRADEVNRFYLNLLDKAMKKESVEMAEEAMKLINNNLCKMLMGKSFSEYDEAEKVRGLVTESDALSKKFFLAAILRRPLAKLGISLFKKDLAGISRRFDEVLEKILVEYEETHDEQHQGTEMLDVLHAACQDKTAEYKITRNHIKSLFVDLFIAGTDTSTHTIQWTMAEILNNTKILERLREEIDSVVGKTRLIQETDLTNLPYLQAVVKEGLRLHPPAPLVVRTFREGCKIGGFDVLEKTTLVVNCYAVMRDPDFWEDPEEFKPERFLASSRSGQEEETKEEVLKYIPFGSGRRGCPGSNLAYLSVGTAIGVMVQCFDWKIEGDKVNMEEARGAMTLTMAHPLKCTPLLRTLNPFTSILQIPSV
uniref:Cytochrome P450 705A8 n=1 Tax=Isatis tinctoria TaxID=161756 RepID=A0A8F0K7V1_ISATI|nr:cytochrome P450 705A8 [Isatis tinctoria]